MDTAKSGVVSHTPSFLAGILVVAVGLGPAFTCVAKAIASRLNPLAHPGWRCYMSTREGVVESHPTRQRL
jgi:hypothetical protein